MLLPGMLKMKWLYQYHQIDAFCMSIVKKISGQNGLGRVVVKGGGKEGGSDLRGVFLTPIQDCSICQVTETRPNSLILVVLIPLAQSFRAEVPCVAKGLVGAVHGISLGHKDLATKISCGTEAFPPRRTLSNAVEHARGCVATKIGFWDILGAAGSHSWQAIFQVLLQDEAGRRMLSIKVLEVNEILKLTISNPQKEQGETIWI